MCHIDVAWRIAITIAAMLDCSATVFYRPRDKTMQADTAKQQLSRVGGDHLTLLNVRSAEDLREALNEVWWSANSDSAITYRKRVGLFTRPSIAVVVQSLLDPDAAGGSLHASTTRKGPTWSGTYRSNVAS